MAEQKPRMPQMFDWIKVYLNSLGIDGKPGEATDEATLIDSLDYYTDPTRHSSFKDSAIPSWWEQDKVDIILGHGPGPRSVKFDDYVHGCV